MCFSRCTTVSSFSKYFIAIYYCVLIVFFFFFIILYKSILLTYTIGHTKSWLKNYKWKQQLQRSCKKTKSFQNDLQDEVCEELNLSLATEPNTVFKDGFQHNMFSVKNNS